MVEIEKIFLGHTKADSRAWIVHALAKLRKTHDKLIIPCVGQFTLARAGILAGFDPGSIITSDISLFSTLLGVYYSGDGSVKDIPFRIAEKRGYKESWGDVRKISYLLWLMKVGQIKPKNYYMKCIKEELIASRERHIGEIKSKLMKYKPLYDGIRYEVKDIRAVLEEDYGSRAIVIVEPPIFRKGYTKMFDFGGLIEWSPEIAEFDFDRDYKKCYDQSVNKKELYIWYRYKGAEGYPERHIFFAKEFDANHTDYWLITKPEMCRRAGLKRMISGYKGKPIAPADYKIIEDDYQITETTKITFRQVGDTTALYYRELFSHKLGTTNAEIFFLMFLDGRLFGTLGLHYGDALRMGGTAIHEIFGFSKHLIKHPNSNRLLRMAATTKSFLNLFMSVIGKARYISIDKYKTTWITKYRKTKANDGLMVIEKKSKLKDGRKKILYSTPFWDRDFKQVIKDYLDEQKAG